MTEVDILHSFNHDESYAKEDFQEQLKAIYQFIQDYVKLRRNESKFKKL